MVWKQTDAELIEKRHTLSINSTFMLKRGTTKKPNVTRSNQT